ncbi:cell division ATP-binding protein FtsE [methanotrophic endosymbiont of Bathymodiolus puteoserpentis (Logatchev)]|jgi:cell division transport system ATP-binding protein|uniref:cell division ATP-binding protein FtsE n=1 Tax=methanotrophic endosymbiont of Bathymodiolus puteoserpentis (Logatchev) TaxID=343235 RepID=UPI0013C67856|nr:cell division ATP-binding protein FtsE [methanotrophic endosymbiont of Bathymodiolus puteoserpentis (Logatchev)]SHE22813.1 Cell division transporter, ATP-binding protein FtsE (TC 3.A.5.1.1) [methanotrophic endosymbiont of Bathymodiolus puteoserpentis (Logatchev)]
MLSFDHVFKRYADAGDTLSDLSFHLDKGEMAFLTGHSGAGKSTLLKLVAIIERCTRGQILVDGQNICRMHDRQVPFLRRKLGLIFQDYKLLFDRTVFDNIALPLIVAGVGRHEVARRVRAALDKVGLLGKENKYPLALSGGEQQRIGIARAVVNKPALILADEPTGNLDPQLSAEIMRLFEQFKQVGVTVLVATHDIELVTKLDHRVLQLDHGTLIKHPL